MGPVLVDVRGWQGGVAETALMAGARAALPGRALVGLVDGALPPLESPARACFDDLCDSPARARRLRPSCFVRLAPREEDALFTAPLLLDPALRSVGLQRGGTTEGLAGAVARYWRARVEQTASAAGLWDRAAACAPAPARAPRLAVLTAAPDLPLCRALERRGARLFGPDPRPLLSPAFSHALFVLGNTAGTRRLLPLLRRFGGAALLPDPCLLAAYEDSRVRALAARELGRPVLDAELRLWRLAVASPPALLLGEVAASADPVIVRSAWMVDAMRERYGCAATLVPPAAPLPRIRAAASGLQAECCVWAVEVLRSWGVAVRLDLRCGGAERAALEALVARLGLAGLVGFEPGVATVSLCLAMRGQVDQAWTLAAHAGAGLRCIATRAVMEAVAVDGVTVLPDQPSPVLLAEAIRAVLPDAAPDEAGPVLAALGLPA